MLKYRYTCIVGTVYAFLVYLLYSSYDAIKRTRFFIGDSIAKSVCDKIDGAVYLDTEATWDDIPKFRKYAFWHYRIKILFTKVFAQDHFGFSPPLIGFSPYTLIEDGSGFYTYCLSNPYFAKEFGAKTFRKKIKQAIQYGPTYGKNAGKNILCRNRLVTAPSDVNSWFLRGRKYELIELESLWKNASEEKQKYILDLFDVNKTIIDNLSHYKVIVLTQNYVTIQAIEEDELVEIYKKAIEEYDERDVIIKPHPNDKVPYQKYFPKAYIMPSYIPMQLMQLIGMKLDVAITINSTAVSMFPQETKIVWLGGKCHPKLAKYGFNECPYRS